MAFFDFLKSDDNDKNSNTFWYNLTGEITLNEIDEQSKKTPVLLFKHSTRCSISFMAKGQLDKSWAFSDEEIKPYYLDLIRYRSVSNEIADHYSITHASPQVLLIKNGKCVYNASHSGISVSEIKEVLKTL